MKSDYPVLPWPGRERNITIRVSVLFCIIFKSTWPEFLFEHNLKITLRILGAITYTYSYVVEAMIWPPAKTEDVFHKLCQKSLHCTWYNFFSVCFSSHFGMEQGFLKYMLWKTFALTINKLHNKGVIIRKY